MTCVATLGWQSLLTQTQEKWWQLLLNCGETVALSTSSNSLKKKKKKTFHSGVHRELLEYFEWAWWWNCQRWDSTQEIQRKKQEFPIIYMEGTMKWEKRGRNWSFKLLWVDWMVTNIMIRCWAVGWINTVWILFSSLPKIVTLGKFPCF